SSSFFFFQAEDGIRDFHVTGVQTCALPIWPEPLALVTELAPQGRQPHRIPSTSCPGVAERFRSTPRALRCSADIRGDYRVLYLRSEERRVGKECRSRWWP